MAAWRVGFYIDAGGQGKYPFVCGHCREVLPLFAKRAAVDAAGFEPDTLAPKSLPRICEVCDAQGAELHHWAPISLFQTEAERWPTSYLCPKCHARWHQKVTPGNSP